MSKLPKKYRFTDLSDYGRPIARFLVRLLEKTPVSSIHITFVFLVVGLLGVYAVYRGVYWLAAILLLVKNILDAADGEMARVRERPTQTGRYLDSIFDFLINLALWFVLFSITNAPVWLFIISFLGLEFQGTIFNYYYLVQRKICSGDVTSKVNEFEETKAFDYESKNVVRALRLAYLTCYGLFDGVMLQIEKGAVAVRPLPKWFMVLVSSMGLGFQILLIALLLLVGGVEFILPFFMFYTMWGIVIIAIRRIFLVDYQRVELHD